MPEVPPKLLDFLGLVCGPGPRLFRHLKNGKVVGNCRRKMCRDQWAVRNWQPELLSGATSCDGLGVIPTEGLFQLFGRHLEVRTSSVVLLLGLEGATQGETGVAGKHGGRSRLGRFLDESQGLVSVCDGIINSTHLLLQFRAIRQEDRDEIRPLLAGFY